MDGVIMDNVGVSGDALEGRLHASIAKTRASTNKKFRDFIAFLLEFCSILPNEHVADNRPFGFFLVKANRADTLHSARFYSAYFSFSAYITYPSSRALETSPPFWRICIKVDPTE